MIIPHATRNPVEGYGTDSAQDFPATAHRRQRQHDRSVELWEQTGCVQLLPRPKAYTCERQMHLLKACKEGKHSSRREDHSQGACISHCVSRRSNQKMSLSAQAVVNPIVMIALTAGMKLLCNAQTSIVSYGLYAVRLIRLKYISSSANLWRAVGRTFKVQS